jgi:hypothetical protein
LLIAAVGVQGNDVLLSQAQQSELLLKNAERLKQMRYVLTIHLRLLFCSTCVVMVASLHWGLFVLSR